MLACQRWGAVGRGGRLGLRASWMIVGQVYRQGGDVMHYDSTSVRTAFGVGELGDGKGIHEYLEKVRPQQNEESKTVFQFMPKHSIYSPGKLNLSATQSPLPGCQSLKCTVFCEFVSSRSTRCAAHTPFSAKELHWQGEGRDDL